MIIGKYERLEMIGEGGMGLVYKGRHVTLGYLVAIKTLPADLAQDYMYIERLEGEAKVLAKLHHPNIVYIHDIESQDDVAYLIMEYVAGRTLADILKEDGTYEVYDALMVIYDIASALAHAHGKGVVHRDIKPANIMITEDGVVKVTDFGIARRTEGTHLTRAGLSVGTWDYMSPEQKEAKEDIDGRSDIYSLGLVFHEMVTGHLPASGESSLVGLDLPEKYMEIMRTCLMEYRANRYQTADDLLYAIENATKPNEGRKWWRYAIGAISVLLVVFLLVVFVPSLNPPVKKFFPRVAELAKNIRDFFIRDRKQGQQQPSPPELRSAHLRERELLNVLRNRPQGVPLSDVRGICHLKTALTEGSEGVTQRWPDIDDFLRHADIIQRVDAGGCDLLLTFKEADGGTELVMRSNITRDVGGDQFEESFWCATDEEIAPRLKAIVHREYCFNVILALSMLRPDDPLGPAIDIKGGNNGTLIIGKKIRICLEYGRNARCLLLDVGLAGVSLLLPHFKKEENLVGAGQVICTADLSVPPPVTYDLLSAIALSETRLMDSYQFSFSRQEKFRQWPYEAIGAESAVELCEGLLSDLSSGTPEAWSVRSFFVRISEEKAPR